MLHASPLLFVLLLFSPTLIALFFPKKYHGILNILGILMMGMGTAMFAPMALDLLMEEGRWVINGHAFGISAAITIFNGTVIMLATRNYPHQPTGPKYIFMLTGLTWAVLSLTAALPFILSNTTSSYTDSFFEALSAITTTGATILTGIDFASPGIVLWRSLLQWLGGVGIIVMAMTILPDLRIGGMQLFQSEFSDRSEKIHSRVSAIASRLVILYAIMTALCLCCLWLADMKGLDAVCHAMTIMATGGFSTMDDSIGAFESITIELITMVFMFLSGTTLLLYIRFAQGDRKSFFHDQQFKAYVLLIIVVTIALTAWRYTVDLVPFLTALREGSFTAISIITTSGFANTDFGVWTQFPVVLIFFLMIIGGCSGSTSSGLKIFRLQIMCRITGSQINSMMRPHGVFIPKLNDKPIETTVIAAVLTFITLYLFIGVMIALCLSAYNLDFMTSLSGAFSSLSNVGPGLGKAIGPGSNYQALPMGAKWVLMGGMLLGRLEIMTILIFFSPAFWRH